MDMTILRKVYAFINILTLELAVWKHWPYHNRRSYCFHPLCKAHLHICFLLCLCKLVSTVLLTFYVIICSYNVAQIEGHTHLMSAFS